MILDADHIPVYRFDPATPRLTYEDVRDLIGLLHRRALRTLAQGPIPEDEVEPHWSCRACDALIIEQERKTRGAEAARLLMAWHDNLSGDDANAKLFDLGMDVLAAKLFPPPDLAGKVDRMIDQVAYDLGCISYGRCCTMYALATAEILRRGEEPPW